MNNNAGNGANNCAGNDASNGANDGAGKYASNGANNYGGKDANKYAPGNISLGNISPGGISSGDISQGDISGISGYVSNIQRASFSDGPGIRTTVFLSGCPLGCQWCHNPETRANGPVLMFYENKCSGCGACVLACERGAQKARDGRRGLDRSLCVRCGACVRVCPADALELRGAVMDAESVMVVVRRDKPFYDASGGGVTVSGGEPLYQFDFTRELLRAARTEAIHTCLDTSGWGGRAAELVPLVDMFLWDIKETDAERHLAFTGVELPPILGALRAVGAAGGAIRLRCPLISGVNARADHMRAVGELANGLKSVAGIDLIAYHNLGVSKQLAMGLKLSRFEPLTDEERATLLAALTKTTPVPARWHI